MMMSLVVFAVSAAFGVWFARHSARQPYECFACGATTDRVAFYLDRPVCPRCAPSACRAANKNGRVNQ